MTVTNNFIF